MLPKKKNRPDPPDKNDRHQPQKERRFSPGLGEDFVGIDFLHDEPWRIRDALKCRQDVDPAVVPSFHNAPHSRRRHDRRGVRSTQREADRKRAAFSVTELAQEERVGAVPPHEQRLGAVARRGPVMKEGIEEIARVALKHDGPDGLASGRPDDGGDHVQVGRQPARTVMQVRQDGFSSAKGGGKARFGLVVDPPRCAAQGQGHRAPRVHEQDVAVTVMVGKGLELGEQFPRARRVPTRKPPARDFPENGAFRDEGGVSQTPGAPLGDLARPEMNDGGKLLFSLLPRLSGLNPTKAQSRGGESQSGQGQRRFHPSCECRHPSRSLSYKKKLTVHTLVVARSVVCDEATPCFKSPKNVFSQPDTWDCFVARIAPRNDPVNGYKKKPEP